MQADYLGDQESAYADLSQYKRLTMPIQQREKPDTVIDTSRHTHSSNGASQFKGPPTPRLPVQPVEQIQQNGSHSVPGSYPSHRSPQFRVPITPFPDVPTTPLPSIPTTPPGGGAQFRVPITPFPDVPTIPLPNIPTTPPNGATQFRVPATSFPKMPVTPMPGSPSLESKEREFKINRQSNISPQLRLPSRKAEVPVTERPTDVPAAFPLTLPYMPLPTSSEQQVQSLSLAHQHSAIDDYALYSQIDSTIAGKAQERQSLDGRSLAFTSIFSRKAKILLWAYLVFCALFNVAFILWIIKPNHIILSSNSFIESLLVTSLIALVTIEFIRIIQGISLLFFALHAKDPIPLSPTTNLRVAILTTFVRWHPDCCVAMSF